MQVIVTSYRRPLYLRRTLESLRQDSIELYVVDVGADQETREYIERTADGALFLDHDPGADGSKTEGIKRFVTDPEFLITSDDLVFPAGYSSLISDQYRKLNAGGLQWTFCSCNLGYIRDQFPNEFPKINGVRIREVETSQVSGAIVDTAICRKVGYFPVYGKSGQGDWAFSKRLRALGLRMGYFWEPMLDHIGGNKHLDYPEYTKEFRIDEDTWWERARVDDKR